MRSTRIIQIDKVLTHLDDEGRGVHPRALFCPRYAHSLSVRLRLLVLCNQRQDPHRRIVLVDHLALGRQALQTLKLHIATVRHSLDLVPALLRCSSCSPFVTLQPFCTDSLEEATILSKVFARFVEKSRVVKKFEPVFPPEIMTQPSRGWHPRL